MKCTSERILWRYPFIYHSKIQMRWDATSNRLTKSFLTDLTDCMNAWVIFKGVKLLKFTRCICFFCEQSFLNSFWDQKICPFTVMIANTLLKHCCYFHIDWNIAKITQFFCSYCPRIKINVRCRVKLTPFLSRVINSSNRITWCDFSIIRNLSSFRIHWFFLWWN